AWNQAPGEKGPLSADALRRGAGRGVGSRGGFVRLRGEAVQAAGGRRSTVAREPPRRHLPTYAKASRRVARREPHPRATPPARRNFAKPPHLRSVKPPG